MTSTSTTGGTTGVRTMVVAARTKVGKGNGIFGGWKGNEEKRNINIQSLFPTHFQIIQTVRGRECKCRGEGRGMRRSSIVCGEGRGEKERGGAIGQLHPLCIVAACGVVTGVGDGVMIDNRTCLLYPALQCV
ncbi:hypothetical protein E2C01_023266 [Portunus trituberculatus]|uniref:Uncharacterized protein n=1 Tax=Portunus trituberculatus TaxID=210409 RepID=A0A5B7E7J5_PORTR|nr:hypothetical protein [Portunus trituberculatus]